MSGREFMFFMGIIVSAMLLQAAWDWSSEQETKERECARCSRCTLVQP